MTELTKTLRKPKSKRNPEQPPEQAPDLAPQLIMIEAAPDGERIDLEQAIVEGDAVRRR